MYIYVHIYGEIYTHIYIYIYIYILPNAVVCVRVKHAAIKTHYHQREWDEWTLQGLLQCTYWSYHYPYHI